MFSAFDTLSAAGGRNGVDKVQECWTFDHPRPDVVVDEQGAHSLAVSFPRRAGRAEELTLEPLAGLPLTNHHNARSAHLSFHIPRAGVCHGFAGYFEAVLYDDVMLSIHPERAAGDMLSWFPIFFPLSEPLYLPAHSELDVEIWRLTDNTKRRVWFEWAAQAYLPLAALGGGPGSAGGRGPGGRSSMTSPPTSATSGSFSLRGGGALSPTLGGSEAAFASAPSPHLGASFGDGRMPGIAEENTLLEGSVLGGAAGGRIKISQTRLHNPGGKTSWIGL